VWLLVDVVELFSVRHRPHHTPQDVRLQNVEDEQTDEALDGHEYQRTTDAGRCPRWIVGVRIVT